jgi:hypothetical protein
VLLAPFFEAIIDNVLREACDDRRNQIYRLTEQLVAFLTLAKPQQLTDDDVLINGGLRKAN